MKIIKVVILTAFLLFGMYIHAQMVAPVAWKFSVNKQSELVVTASIEPGWHLYGLTLPEGGPSPTVFHFDKISGAKTSGKVYSKSPLIARHDAVFGLDLNWFEHSAVFIQKLQITDPAKFHIEGNISYMACNDQSCTADSKDFSISNSSLPKGVKVDKNTVSSDELNTKIPGENTKGKSVDTVSTDTLKSQLPVQNISADTVDTRSDLWAPVVSELKTLESQGQDNNSLLYILLSGFIGGLIALLTPCVWPMIPMTVSFFLKRSKSDRKKAVRDAITYGISIIAIYLIVGLLITSIYGASAMNELATSAVFNIIFFLLLVLFAVSFFGAFELTLPSSWTTKLDSKADSTTGVISIFFMAFTLVLVSFSCTGPIIGFLLVEAASKGSILGPAAGMFGFAFALSIPFALFALFPTWLQKLPKSGGWLNSVKVVLGFLELALSLKFLSVADLAYGWHILDREVFLVLWIVIFAMLGFYLLGKIKFPHDSDLPYVSVPRAMMAIFSFAFAIYMLPGLWGAPLKAISAFSPPLNTQDFSLYKGGVEAKFKDYDEGMAYAAKVGKPVMMDFTGFGCVNCRKMEAAVWSDPRVKNRMDNDYVLISVYVDDKTSLPRIQEVKEGGGTVKLRTVGDKWSYLQRSKFGANAQPFYVLLDNQGHPLTKSYAYDTDVNKYIKFLQRGIEVYKSRMRK